MRVLLLAPRYMGLYKSIIRELKSQDYEVVYIEDKPLMFNYRFNYHHTWIESARNYFYKLIRNNFFSVVRYWESQLSGLIDKKFDALFVVNGFSYDNMLLKLLKKHNENIKTRLYLWDNLYVYDFRYVIQDFDSCYTLDFLDAIQNDKLNFLPSFWIQEASTKFINPEYDVFMVGTNHDDRYYVTKKVVKQLKEMRRPFFIKLIDRFRFKSDLISHEFIPTAEYNNMMMKSRCILDTERSSQTGPTVRMIWALALGKKIITTNTYMTRMPFFNPNQIMILDRKYPILDENFLDNVESFTPNEYVMSLRIDNWIKKIFS